MKVELWTPVETLEARAGEESASTVYVDGEAPLEMTQEMEPSRATVATGVEQAPKNYPSTTAPTAAASNHPRPVLCSRGRLRMWRLENQRWEPMKQLLQGQCKKQSQHQWCLSLVPPMKKSCYMILLRRRRTKFPNGGYAEAPEEVDTAVAVITTMELVDETPVPSIVAAIATKTTTLVPEQDNQAPQTPVLNEQSHEDEMINVAETAPALTPTLASIPAVTPVHFLTAAVQPRQMLKPVSQPRFKVWFQHWSTYWTELNRNCRY
jgi:hypothetical protein